MRPREEFSIYCSRFVPEGCEWLRLLLLLLCSHRRELGAGARWLGGYREGPWGDPGGSPLPLQFPLPACSWLRLRTEDRICPLHNICGLALICGALFLGALGSMLFYASTSLKGYTRHCEGQNKSLFLMPACSRFLESLATSNEWENFYFFLLALFLWLTF